MAWHQPRTRQRTARDYALVVRHNFARRDLLRRIRFPAFGGDLFAVVRSDCELDPGVLCHRVRVPGFSGALQRTGLMLLDNALLDLRAVIATARAGIRAAIDERCTAGGCAGLRRVRLELMEGVWQTVVDRLLSSAEPRRVGALGLEFCACAYIAPLAAELVPGSRNPGLAAVLAALRALPGHSDPIEIELLIKACARRNRHPLQLGLPCLSADAALPTWP